VIKQKSFTIKKSNKYKFNRTYFKI